MNAPAPLAVIGAGLIGAGWAALFALRGHAVRVADPAPGARRLVLDTLEAAFASVMGAHLAVAE